MKRQIAVALTAAGVFLMLAVQCFASGPGNGRMGASMAGNRPLSLGVRQAMGQGNMNQNGGSGAAMPQGKMGDAGKGPGMLGGATTGAGAPVTKMGDSRLAAPNDHSKSKSGATGSTATAN